MLGGFVQFASSVSRHTTFRNCGRCGGVETGGRGDSVCRAAFPELRNAVETVGARVSAAEALENLRVIEQTQRLLRTNVQEALALEVGLLKLRL